jgi:hypothetical protein
MALRNQPADTETPGSRWNWLYKLGGAAALIVLGLFAVGIFDLFTESVGNWLIVLFKLNVGADDVQAASLSVLNFLDIVIMALAGTVFIALCAALWRTNKIWPALAASLAFLGIVLLIITRTAGRSGLLLGALIVSAVMLRSHVFGQVTAYVGIVASVLLLFVGDIGTSLFSSSNIIAVLIGIGYVLWMAWFFLVGRRLLRLGDGKPGRVATRDSR